MNSAAGSFGLSFGLAVAGGLMLWALALSFTHQTEASTVIPPAQQQAIATQMDTSAEIMSNTDLQQRSRTNPRTSRTPSSTSTPRPGTAPYKSRCSSPPSPDFSASPTRSACDASQTSHPQRRSKASTSDRTPIALSPRLFGASWRRGSGNRGATVGSSCAISRAGYGGLCSRFWALAFSFLVKGRIGPAIVIFVLVLMIGGGAGALAAYA